MKTVLCMLPLEPRHRALLEAAAPGCRFLYAMPDAAAPEQLAEANILLGAPDPKLLRAAANLELLQLSSAGADSYVQPGVLAEGVLLTNSTGAYSQTVAEHALAMLLTLVKKLHRYRDAQMQHRWTDLGTVGSVRGSVVLIVGLGDIGLHFAGLVKALGAYVIGIKRTEGEKPSCVDELYTTQALDALLPRADVVFSVLPGTKQTTHLYTADRFDRMKKSAIFLNFGRGSAVENTVLYDALTQGKISAAGIDVCEVEPLPPDSPLWSLENLLLTPHASGGYHLPHTLDVIVDIAADNLARFLRGAPLRNIVDFKTGYRK